MPNIARDQANWSGEAFQLAAQKCGTNAKLFLNSFLTPPLSVSLSFSLSLFYTIFTHVIVLFEQTFWEILEFMGGLSGKAV